MAEHARAHESDGRANNNGKAVSVWRKPLKDCQMPFCSKQKCKDCLKCLPVHIAMVRLYTNGLNWFL